MAIKMSGSVARPFTRLLGFGAVLVLVAAFPGAGVAAGPITELVSVDSDETSAVYGAAPSDVSNGGRYVLLSTHSPNLVVGDTNAKHDVFVRDRFAGTTERVSVDSAGNEANGSSYGRQISNDGRFVLFISHASNLIAGDDNNRQDVFVHDMQTGITEVVSARSDGSFTKPGTLPSAAMSSDGRFVTFASSGNGLTSDRTNKYPQIFVHDRVTADTELVSAGRRGRPANDICLGSSVSADGQKVAFTSYATNLVRKDTPRKRKVFVAGLTHNTVGVRLVSKTFDGSRVDGYGSDGATIADDGRTMGLGLRCLEDCAWRPR